MLPYDVLRKMVQSSVSAGCYDAVFVLYESCGNTSELVRLCFEFDFDLIFEYERAIERIEEEEEREFDDISESNMVALHDLNAQKAVTRQAQASLFIEPDVVCRTAGFETDDLYGDNAIDMSLYCYKEPKHIVPQTRKRVLPARKARAPRTPLDRSQKHRERNFITLQATLFTSNR